MGQEAKNSLRDFIDTKVMVIVFITLLFLLLIGVGVWYQQGPAKQIQTLEHQLSLMASEREALQDEVNQLKNENTALQGTILDLRGEGGKRSVYVLFPNGGESLCLGEEMVIRWQSKGVSAVRVRLVEYRGESRGYYYLAHSSPASSDESGEPGKGLLVWRVGEHLLGDNTKVYEIKEGYSYKIELTSVDGESIVSDLSDDVFSILRCQG